MNPKEELVMEDELFSAMGRIWPSERNSLSPLPDYTIEPLTKRTIQSLQKRNLITLEGKINPEIVPFFDMFLKPFHLCEISIINENKSVNYSVFFNSQTDSGTFLNSFSKTTEISTSDLSDQALEEIKASLPVKVDLFNESPITLPLENAWIFAAIFDLFAQKKSKLSKLDSKKLSTNKISAVNQMNIKTALKQFADSKEWVLLSLISILTGAQPDPDQGIESGLDWLVEKSLIGKNENGYFLGADYESMVLHLFPIISIITFLSATQKNSLNIENQKIACLSSQDMIFLLAYREDEGRILFRQDYPESLLKSAKQILTKPEPLFPIFGFEIDDTTSVACPVCSQMQSKNNPECTNCGASFSESIDSWENRAELLSEALQTNKISILAKLSKKSVSTSNVEQAENATGEAKGSRSWVFLLIMFFLIIIVCFTFIMFSPITIHF